MKAEPTGIQPRKGAWTLAAVLATVLIAIGLVAGFLALQGGLREPPPHPPQRRAAPVLQTNEAADRAAIEARATARLHSGTAIDEAMRQTAAAGWDAAP